MTRNEIKKEMGYIPSCIEELKQKIQQLETENNMASTLTSQKEVNTYLIGRCNHSILMLERKLRYLLLFLEKPQTEEHNLYDAITSPYLTHFRYSPSKLLTT